MTKSDIKPPRFYYDSFVVNFDPEHKLDCELYNYFTKPIPTHPRKNRSKAQLAALSIPFRKLLDATSNNRPINERLEAYKTLLDHCILLVRTLDLKLSLTALLIVEENKADAEKSLGIHQKHHLFNYEQVAAIFKKRLKGTGNQKRPLALLTEIEKARDEQIARINNRLKNLSI